jgi:chromosome segregation ATPase
MPWPRRQANITELELKRQLDTLQLQLVRLRTELTNKQQYAGRQEDLLRERMERIDELNATIERLREQNRRSFDPLK